MFPERPLTLILTKKNHVINNKSADNQVHMMRRDGRKIIGYGSMAVKLPSHVSSDSYTADQYGTATLNGAFLYIFVSLFIVTVDFFSFVFFYQFQ